MAAIDDVIAYIGGVLLAICLLPQLHIMWKNRSAADVAVSWTLLYISGLLLTFVYLIRIAALAGWISLLPEIILALVVLGSKFYLDRFGYNAEKLAKTVPTNTELSEEEKLDSFDQTNYRGYHVFFDYTGVVSKDSAELTNWIMKMIEDILVANRVRFVHKHAVVFDGTDSPPGFTSVFLIDESHVSAHSYSDLGMLALDIFTCGGRPDITKKVAAEIHRGVMNRFPDCQSRVNHARRFPTNLDNRSLFKAESIV